jgi:hypothetical protein
VREEQLLLLQGNDWRGTALIGELLLYMVRNSSRKVRFAVRWSGTERGIYQETDNPCESTNEIHNELNAKCESDP